MRVRFFLAMVISCITLSVSAQEKRDTIRGSGDKRADLRTELHLSKQQSKQLKEVNQDIRTKLTAIRSDTTLLEETRKKEQRKLLKERQEKINALLTPEQKQKYQALQKEQLQKRRSKKIMDDDSIEIEN
jgi:protein CpxP